MKAKADTTAFTQHIQQHQRLIYKVCSIYAAGADDRKDLFQEIVIRAWTAYPRFRHEASFSTWLYRIALNTAISYNQWHKRRHTEPYDDKYLGSLPDFGTAEQEAEHQVLQQVIGSLPALEKALILLYLEDRPHQEIAAIMGISVSNVGTRLGRIREKLKKMAQPLINR